MQTINISTTFYTPAEAEATAAVLQANDPDWTYVATHDPKGTGYSFISIFDEDGEFVGKYGC